jgi:peptidoglycan/xylan/chitin deacetylase (PgdA/CDA1 family)
MRKILKIILAVFVMITMILSITSIAWAKASDVKGHWAQTQINDWIGRGLVKGYSDGTFKPDNPISRAEFCALVNRSFGFVRKANSVFTDVSPKDWYADDISKAVAQGYLTGFPDKTAGPDKNITRQEVVTILARILKLKINNSAITKYADDSKLAVWGRGSAAAVSELGYVNTYPDKTFRPNNDAIRAEVVYILSKAAGELYNTAGAFGPETGTNELAGNATINRPGISLKNMVIKGNLYLSEGIGEGSITLENVKVLGTTTICGGGEHGIILIGSSLGDIVNEPDNGKVRLVRKAAMASTTTAAGVNAAATGGNPPSGNTSDGNTPGGDPPGGDNPGGNPPPAQITVASVNAVPDIRVSYGTAIGAVTQPVSVILNLSNSTTCSAIVTGWDTSGYNPNTAGTYAIPVTFTLPTGITNPGGLTVSVNIVVAPASAPITVTSVNTIPNIRVSYGTTLGTITQPASVILNLSNSTTCSAIVTGWDTSGYNANTAGTYAIPVTFAPPSGVTNPSGLKASVNIIVSPVPITVANVNAIPDIRVAYGTTPGALTLPASVILTLSNLTTCSAIAKGWDISGYNPNTAGTYIIPVAFAPPSGVTNPSGLKASVNIVVAAAPITVVSVGALSDILVPYRTTLGAITLPESVILNLSDTTTCSALISRTNWNTSQYDPNTGGRHRITGMFELPPNITNPGGVEANLNIIVLLGVTADLIGDRNVVKGTPIEEVHLPTSVAILLTDGSTCTAGINWSSFDPNILGTHTLTGSLIMPEGVEYQRNATVSMKVHVIQPVIDPRPDTPVISSAGTLINEFDSLTSDIVSTGGRVELDTRNKVSGSASLNITCGAPSGGGEFSVDTIVERDMSNLQNMQFCFYVPDKTEITHVSIRIYSGSDGSFTRWIGAWQLVNGWNRITQARDDFQVNFNPSWANITRISVLVEAQPGCKPSVNFDRIGYSIQTRPKVLFTFDDGWYDLIDSNIPDNAFSYLTSKGFTGTVWAKMSSSAHSGTVHEMDPNNPSTPLYMNEAELDDLYNAGWDIGNHTVSHLDDLDKRSEAQIRSEFELNQNWLVDRHWTRGAYFAAYPSGIYNERMIELMRDVGVLAARTTDYGLQSMPVDNMYKLKCIYLDPAKGVADVRQQIDYAIQTGTTIVFMIHRVLPASGPLAMSTSDFKAIVDYLDQHRSSIDVVTMSEWYNAYAGLPQSVVSISSVSTISPVSVPLHTTDAALEYLPETVHVTLSDTRTADVSVRWNTSNYNPNEYGTYPLTGTLVLPGGISNPDPGLSAHINVIVEPQSITLVPTIQPVRVPLHATTTDVALKYLPKQVNVTLSNGRIRSLNVASWNPGTYNPNVSGTYPFTGTFELPDGIINPNNTWRALVNVIVDPTLPRP